MGRRRGRHRIALLVVPAIVACALPAVASAHAYLVGSDPAAGARLDSSPTRAILRFNEAFVRGSAGVSLRRTDGTRVTLPPALEQGATIVQPLPPGLHGIFLLTWKLLSDDGHPTQGSIPFSVGATGALPAATTSEGPTQWPEVAAGWLLFAGLALAFGGILSERLVWRAAPVAAPVLFGIGVAVGAAAISLVLLAGDRVHGDLVSGLDVQALRDVAASRPGVLTVAVVVALLAAAALVIARLPVVALVSLAAAGVFVAYRGHAGTSGDWWAPPADAVHLLAAAAWTGALAHLVLVLGTAQGVRSAAAVPVRRYAELALPTVLIVLGTGILTALAEFQSLSSLVDTGYGRTLLVKSGLVLGALCLALASRLFALRPKPGVDVPLLRRLTPLELGLVVAVLAAAGLLVNLAPPRSSVAATSVAPTPAAPLLRSVPLRRATIPTGPFVSASEDEDLAVGFAATPGGAGRIAVTATIVDQNGNGANGLDVTVGLRSDRPARAGAVPCGPGCYRAAVAADGPPQAAAVTIRRPDGRSTTTRFAFPSRWPPASATRIAQRATRVFRALRTVTIDERISSGGGPTMRTTWRLGAPNRLTYAIRGGSRAIVIGDTRWDREPGTPWVKSPQEPLRQPTPTWVAAPRSATLLGSGTTDGRPVWRISFVDPSVPAWYTVSIDKRTYRTLALEMTAAAHFMRQVYSGFDEPVSIVPPRSP
jgi:copper transport protein